MKLRAFDIDNIIRRNWEAAQGKELSAAFQRTLSYIASMRDGWDRIIIAADGGPSFRKLKVPEYKSGRIDPGPAYREQRMRTIDRLRSDGCIVIYGPQIEPGGFAEADDVLAWIAEQHSNLAGAEDILSIVSDDGDLEGLIDDAHNITVHKVTRGESWNAARVREVRGVDPIQVYDFKALAGDKPDGYDGFRGIGDTWAAWLVRTFGGVLPIFSKANLGDERFDKAKGGKRIRQILIDGGIELASKGLFLARPRTDLALDFEALVLPEPQATATPDANDADYSFEETLPAEDAAPDPPEKPAATQSPEASPTEATRRPSAAIVVHEARAAMTALDPHALQPRTLAQLFEIGRCLYQSRMYPQFPNVEGIMAAAIEARERGIPLGTALRSAYVVKGRLAWSASFLAGLVLSSGKARIFKIVESTDKRAVLRWARADDSDPPQDFSFTIEEAQRAGWLRSGEKGDSKGSWITNPRTMLRWAAMREAARAFFPDCVSGMYTPDEIRGGHVEDAELEEGE